MSWTLMWGWDTRLLWSPWPCEGTWNTQKRSHEERLTPGVFAEMWGRLRELRNHSEVPRNYLLVPLVLKGQGEGTVPPEPDKNWRHGRGLQPQPDWQGRGAVVMGWGQVNALTSPSSSLPAFWYLPWLETKSKVRLQDLGWGRKLAQSCSWWPIRFVS